MKEQHNQKKLSIYITLLIVVICLFGISFALFKFNASQATQNDITTLNCFEVEYSDVTDAITIANDFPISDADGLERTPYTFKIKNKCSQYLNVQIGVETLTSSQIEPTLIKGVITKKGETPTSAKLLSAGILGTPLNGGTNYILLEDSIYGTQTKEYDLRLWFTESMTKDQGSGKTYQGKVTVVSSPKTETERLLSAAIMSDNTVTEPLTVPGTEISSSTEAILASTEDDYDTSYYFRGTVTNNFVEYANMCWRIVRVTGNGAIKLVLYNYNGLTSTNNTPSSSNPCNVAEDFYAYARYEGSAFVSAFNSSYNDNVYVGFMYGAVGASSYAAAHANTNPSTILTNLNKWYTNVLSKQSNFSDTQLADTIWCNDKSVVTDTAFNPGNNTVGTNYGYGKNYNYYSAAKRLSSSSGSAGGTGPSLICSNDNNGGKLSKFTVSDTEYGNGALSGYAKVGLLTADEIAFAGGAHGTTNSTYYLKGNTGSSFWWSLSPDYFLGGYANVWAIDGSSSSLDTSSVNGTYGLRPSLSLVSSTKVTGVGIATNPYKVIME
ncbi:MAG: hypothetical protein Q4C44_02465 [bacterium]|nr:hypothetical protein [bacterium]